MVDAASFSLLFCHSLSLGEKLFGDNTNGEVQEDVMEKMYKRHCVYEPLILCGLE